MNSFRVLHIYRYFDPDFTGDGIYFQKLIPLLLDPAGRQDVLAVTTPAPAVENRWKLPGSDVYYLNGERYGTRLSWLRLQWFMLRHAYRYDAIHLHTHVDRYFVAYLLARIAGCRILYSSTLEDSPRLLLESYKPLYRPLICHLFRLIDRFIAISPKLRDDSIDLMAPGQMELVPQGAELPEISVGMRAQNRAALGLAPDDVALLYVGSISRRKDVGFLLDQMPMLLRNQPRLKLFVIGPALESDYAQSLWQMIEKSGISKVVRVTGQAEDPAPYYRAADLFVFASRSEGFGNVLLEAMAYGLPVVSRRLTGVTDFFIANEANGLLFETPETYRNAVLRLVSDPELRHSLGAAARLTVERNFALSSAASRFRAVYADVVSGANLDRNCRHAKL